MLPTYIKRPDGSVYINPAKRYVKPYWLLTQGPPTIAGIAQPNAPEGILLGAGVTSPPISMPIDSAGHFEAFYAMCQRQDPATGVAPASTPVTAATITLFDPGTSRFLMNQPCHIDTVVSGGATNTAAQRPFIWPESYFFNVEDAGRSVIATFRNLDVANQLEIFFTLHGRRFYTKEAPPEVYNKMYEYFGKKERTNVYFLTTDVSPVVVAAGATVVTNTRVTDEADMEVFKISSVSTGSFDFVMRDTSTGRTLSNGTVTGSTGSGTAEFPFIFPEPLLLERNHQIQIEFTDTQFAPAQNTIFFTMTGRRLYYAE